MPHDPNKAGSIDLTASVRIDEINATVRNYVAPDPFTARHPGPQRLQGPGVGRRLEQLHRARPPLPDGSPVFKAERRDQEGGRLRLPPDRGQHRCAHWHVRDQHRLRRRTSPPGRTPTSSSPTARTSPATCCSSTSRPACSSASAVPSRPPRRHRPSGQPNVWCDDTTATKPEGRRVPVPRHAGQPGAQRPRRRRLRADGGARRHRHRQRPTQHHRHPVPDRRHPAERGQRRPARHRRQALRRQPAGHQADQVPRGELRLPVGHRRPAERLRLGDAGLRADHEPVRPVPGDRPRRRSSPRLAANGDPSGPFDFEAAGRLGDANDSVSSSRLQRIYSSSTACTNRDSRPDFPLFPTNDNVSTYRCIGADLQQTDAAVPDPLALYAKYQAADGKLAQLRNAGINDMPGWFQVNIAKTTLVQGTNDALRRRCGSARRRETAALQHRRTARASTPDRRPRPRSPTACRR